MIIINKKKLLCILLIIVFTTIIITSCNNSSTKKQLVNNDNKCTYISKGCATNTDTSKAEALDSVKNYILDVISKSELEDYDTKDYNEEVNVESLFYIDGNWYIKAKVDNLICSDEIVEEDNIRSYKYKLNPNTYNNGDKNESFNYELWKYNGKYVYRIFSGLNKIIFNENKDGIEFKGRYCDYYIKYKKNDVDDINKENIEIAYDCLYTDKLISKNNRYTCYFNYDFSVCAVDNNTNDIIIYKYITDEDILTKEFQFDNSKEQFPTRFTICDKGWVDDSNIAYISCLDCVNYHFTVDCDNRICRNFHRTGAILNSKYGYVITSYSEPFYEPYRYTDCLLENKYNFITLTNLHTYETINIGKTNIPNVHEKIENDVYLSYETGDCERVKVDISDYIKKERLDIQEETINYLINKLDMNKNNIDRFCYQLRMLDDVCFQNVKYNNKYYLLVKNHNNSKYNMLLKNAENIELYKCGQYVYAYVYEDSIYKVYQCMQDKLIDIVNMRCVDINTSYNENYISFIDNEGNTIVLNNNGKIIFKDNIYICSINENANEESNNNTKESKDIISENKTVKITKWDSVNKLLYIFVKDDDNDLLSKLYCINLDGGLVKDLIKGINNIPYNQFYLSIRNNYLIYDTFKHYCNNNRESNNNQGGIFNIVYFDDKFNSSIHNILDSNNMYTYFSYYINDEENYINYGLNGDNSFFGDYYIEK